MDGRTCHLLVLFYFILCLLLQSGCSRHTYCVTLTNGQRYYADPPLVLDNESRVYIMWIAGQRYHIPLDDVYSLHDVNQICYKNVSTDAFTCFDALYQY